MTVSFSAETPWAEADAAISRGLKRGPRRLSFVPALLDKWMLTDTDRFLSQGLHLTPLYLTTNNANNEVSTCDNYQHYENFLAMQILFF